MRCTKIPYADDKDLSLSAGRLGRCRKKVYRGCPLPVTSSAQVSAACSELGWGLKGGTKSYLTIFHLTATGFRFDFLCLFFPSLCGLERVCHLHYVLGH